MFLFIFCFVSNVKKRRLSCGSWRKELSAMTFSMRTGKCEFMPPHTKENITEKKLSNSKINSNVNVLC